MELIDDVRDYLQLVIERLERMSRLNGLNLNISELKKRDIKAVKHYCAERQF